MSTPTAPGTANAAASGTSGASGGGAARTRCLTTTSVSRSWAALRDERGRHSKRLNNEAEQIEYTLKSVLHSLDIVQYLAPEFNMVPQFLPFKLGE
jgi:hypothetical protein